MINRLLMAEMLRIIESFQVLILTGPRQSGKTTLCKMAFPGYRYLNLENPDTRDEIVADPMTFLKRNDTGMILDEAQQFPQLFSYIQVLVDEDKTKRFVLSGSNNFSLMEKISQSLAGRAAVLTLLPLSIVELGNDIDISTDDFDIDFDETRQSSTISENKSNENIFSKFEIYFSFLFNNKEFLVSIESDVFNLNKNNVQDLIKNIIYKINEKILYSNIRK